VKFLIAGLGSIGRRHLKNLLALGEDDFVLYRTGKSTLPEVELDRYPMETTLEAAFAHNPDAVIISNPTALHLDVAIPAVKRGCHLLIEKPISHTMDHVPELLEATRSSGGKVLVGFQFRFHPGLRSIKRWIESGAIGRPISAYAHWGEYLPEWHPWEDFQTSYAARRELGGGVVLTLCHPFDYLRWFFGEVQWVYGSVVQQGPWEIEVEDAADALLGFASEMQCAVHLDYVQRPPAHILRIIGTEGTILWDNADGIAQIFKPESEVWHEESPPDEFERNHLFLDEMRHFLDVCREGAEPICDLEDGIEALRIALAVKKSSRSGEMIRIPNTLGSQHESPKR
jgi:predicted dehydrogenase